MAIALLELPSINFLPTTAPGGAADGFFGPYTFGF